MLQTLETDWSITRQFAGPGAEFWVGAIWRDAVTDTIMRQASSAIINTGDKIVRFRIQASPTPVDAAHSYQLSLQPI